MKKLILSITLLFGMILTGMAQNLQKMTLNWEGYKDSNLVIVYATLDKEFTVNWGDNREKSYTGKGNMPVYCEHSYFSQNMYRVEITGKTLDCQFFSVDLSRQSVYSFSPYFCKSLSRIILEDNQLESLDLRGVRTISELNCSNNALPLSELYPLSIRIKEIEGKKLGAQKKEADTVAIGLAIDLSTEASLEGNSSLFTIKKEGKIARIKQDYDTTETTGKIIFLNKGNYSIEINNSKLISNPQYPCSYTRNYLVCEQIALQWTSLSQTTKKIKLCATPNKPFTIDWGNGSKDRYMGKGITPVTCSYTYMEDGNYNITISSDSCNFYLLSAVKESISKIDFFGCDSLAELICTDNYISDLNLSKCKNLKKITCNKNALCLSQLFAISSLIPDMDSKILGMQFLAMDTVAIGQEIDLSKEQIIQEQGSSFTIFREDAEAIQNADYTFIDGKLSFLTRGAFTVGMTNPAIVSNERFPVKVIGTYLVTQSISFEWEAESENKSFSISLSNTSAILVDWGDGTQESIRTEGSLFTNCVHRYSKNGIYKVRAYSLNADIVGFLAPESKISELLVFGAPFLRSLNCASNRLYELDLSSCTNLDRVICADNSLQLSTLYAISNQISNPEDKVLGSQHLPLENIAVGVELDLSKELELENTLSKLVVWKNHLLAKENVDYSVSRGQLVFNTEGIFSLEISNPRVGSAPNSPASTTMAFLTATYGVNQNYPETFRVFPNPTKGMVWIETGEEGLPDVRVFSQWGVLLLYIQTLQVNLSGYPNGLYYIHVNNRAVKVIKN